MARREKIKNKKIYTCGLCLVKSLHYSSKNSTFNINLIFYITSITFYNYSNKKKSLQNKVFYLSIPYFLFTLINFCYKEKKKKKKPPRLNFLLLFVTCHCHWQWQLFFLFFFFFNSIYSLCFQLPFDNDKLLHFSF